MTNQSTERSGTAERPGHHWREPARVQEYVERMDRRAAERQEPLTLLTRLLPFPADAALRVLDVGAGYGAVAAAVLAAFPRAEATLLDISEAMMQVGAERMAPFAGRYRYLHGDFADGELPEAAAGPFQAIVSGRAIHHLPPAATRSLYRACAARLAPGGCFLNLDMTAAVDGGAAAAYRRAEEREREARGEPAAPPRSHHAEHEGHDFQPLDEHLRWLREAGLVSVDCYWKRLGNALFGGLRPS
ncbi:MAG TPA: class I SAM-dependent methyltransferase [Dehalococcoidia bacterium]|nr:class I SAM-dependent methyltransferase [Dehalococcoidia bacterium]